MFNRNAKIYTAYEKPEAAEPSARMELVRDGFSWMAFLFNFFWMLYHRLWREAFVYMAILVALTLVTTPLGLSEITVGLVQFWLQLLIAFHASDLRGRALARQGYRMAGVLVASNDTEAERRYHEFAA